MRSSARGMLRFMAKQAEIDYLKNAGEGLVEHAVNKPFSDAGCAFHLFRLGAILLLLPPPPARLLDLGCGTGWTSCFFSRRGYSVLGLDISLDMIGWAERNRDRDGLQDLTFIVADYEALPFTSEFDCAVFYDSLHHAEDEGKAIKAVFKALRPGGRCVLCEPGKGHERSGDAINAIQKYGVTEKAMPPSTIRRIARRAGFRRVDIYAHPGGVNSVVCGTSSPRFARVLLKSRLVRDLALSAYAILSRSSSGTVVLTK